MPLTTRFRVLFVDNDLDACEMVSFLLNLRQIDVTCSQSAADARLKLKSQGFELIILDVWLPDVDGFEFCRQLRAVDSKTPVLFYSGAAYDADRKEGLAAGANAYLVKPNIERLTETVLSLLVQHVSRGINTQSGVHA